jgi:DNA-3-methyladenine glycosylase I
MAFRAHARCTKVAVMCAAKEQSQVRRCAWAEGHPLLATYHDQEWGVPIHDDMDWYGKLLLDGAQAGLSWLTILKKRDAYRAAFCDFDPSRVARFGPRDVERLMQDEGIVRNRLKIESAIKNARAFLEVQKEFGSFDAYIWQAVGGAPIQNRVRHMRYIPARTELSDALSKDLKRRGFSFVGSTIVYAFLQAAGVVNDHVLTCFRHAQVAGAVRAKRPKPRRSR